MVSPLYIGLRSLLEEQQCAWSVSDPEADIGMQESFRSARKHELDSG